MSDAGGIGWLRPGARLIGKYEIVRPIGRGGFGLVYEARHLGLRAPVAIKVLRSEGRQHPQTLERFRREAWASTQIASPHVVRLTDVDVLEDGTPFLVMELLSGRDLEAELAARGRLPIREAIGYVLQAASAIAEAHAHGVVHRDLKPSNLFLAEQGGSRSLKRNAASPKRAPLRRSLAHSRRRPSATWVSNASVVETFSDPRGHTVSSMPKPFSLLVLIATLGAMGCSDDAGTGNSPAGSSGAAGTGGLAGSSSTAGTSGMGGAAAGAAGSAQPIGGGASPAGGAGAGTSGSMAGAAGATAGAGGAAGAGGVVGTGGSVNNVPADYKGTPFATLTIPGRINACDYDRGGANVAFCHDAGGCKGATTGDYPGASGIYRPAMPANAQICGGAACDDNVGVCRMNPNKPDNTITGQAMPATDTYLCYSVPGEWTKYTVHVAEAGAYSISGVMAVPPSGGGANLSFGNNITTGNLSFAVTPNTNSGSGENFHSWDDRKNLGTVTFPAAGTYVMTLTQVSRFNADSFTFTKM